MKWISWGLHHQSQRRSKDSQNEYLNNVNKRKKHTLIWSNGRIPSWEKITSWSNYPPHVVTCCQRGSSAHWNESYRNVARSVTSFIWDVYTSFLFYFCEWNVFLLMAKCICVALDSITYDIQGDLEQGYFYLPVRVGTGTNGSEALSYNLLLVILIVPFHCVGRFFFCNNDSRRDLLWLQEWLALWCAVIIVCRSN